MFQMIRLSVLTLVLAFAPSAQAITINVDWAANFANGLMASGGFSYDDSLVSTTFTPAPALMTLNCPMCAATDWTPNLLASADTDANGIVTAFQLFASDIANPPFFLPSEGANLGSLFLTYDPANANQVAQAAFPVATTGGSVVRFADLQVQITPQNPGGGGNPVPEPASTLLLIAGGLLVAGAIRRSS